MSDQPVDNSRRNWIAATGIAGAAAGAGVAIPFVSTFAPSEKAKAAGAPVEVDISDIKPGGMKTAEWRGNPVWILRRTPDMLEGLKGTEGNLADPDSKRTPDDLTPAYARNPHRSRKEEYLVAIGICSHLGCSPSGPFPGGANVALEGASGFVCPCHGSTFDLAGRVFKNKPAPDNLKVPRHMYVSDAKLIIGQDEQGEA